MDINNLEAFIQVAEKKSFSKTAEGLNITQPAVSKRIAALESDLAARLFDRVGRTVHLTEAGKVLLPSARHIRLELSRIEDVINNLGKEVHGTLSIGATQCVGTRRLSSVLTAFHRKFPDVEIDLRVEGAVRTLADVEACSLELALCVLQNNSNGSPSSRLQSRQIWNDALRVVVAKDHPLASGETVSLAALVGTPAVLPPISSPVRNAIDKALLLHKLEPSVSVEAADYETMRSMTAIGLGWSCLPPYQIDDSLAVLNIEELKVKHSVSLVRHQNRTLSRAARAFLDSLRTQQVRTTLELVC